MESLASVQVVALESHVKSALVLGVKSRSALPVLVTVTVLAPSVVSVVSATVEVGKFRLGELVHWYPRTELLNVSEK